VIDLAVRPVVEDGLASRPAHWHLWRDHHVFVPFATIQHWGEAGGKKAQTRMDTDVLDWALADFSGYVAADALYDGPFCMLSAVDNRGDKRILSDVSDHAPTHEDIRGFLGRLKTALAARDLTLLGVTTDGAARYPEPLREVFGEVPPQRCQFPVVQDIVRAVLSAVASERKSLAAKHPPLPRGRPSTKAAKQVARKQKRWAQKSADVYKHRHLCVKHDLSTRDRKTFGDITRGFPQLRK
jgi:hypothetical protein